MTTDADEALLYGIVELLKTWGEAQAVALLLDSDVAVERECYDNWNGGMYYVSVVVTVEYRVYGMLEDAERSGLEGVIRKAAEPILAPGENDTFTGAKVRPGG